MRATSLNIVAALMLVLSAQSLGAAVLGTHYPSVQQSSLAKGASKTVVIGPSGSTVLRFTPKTSGNYLLTLHLFCSLGTPDGFFAPKDGEGIAFSITQTTGVTTRTLPGTSPQGVGACSSYGIDYGSTGNEQAWARESISTFTKLTAGKTYTFRVRASAVFASASNADKLPFFIRNVVLTVSN